MMRIDDLVERITALQRSDLEAWIRDELVVPNSRTPGPWSSTTWNSHASV